MPPLTSISTPEVQYFFYPSNSILIYPTDAYTTGCVITAVTSLLAFGFTVFLLGFLIPSTRHIAIKYLRLHAYLLFFVDTWLLATLIAFTYFVAKRSVQITAYINGIPLPQAVIDHAEQTSGLKFKYRELLYRKSSPLLSCFQKSIFYLTQ